jgi:hypothetical protein
MKIKRNKPCPEFTGLQIQLEISFRVGNLALSPGRLYRCRKPKLPYSIVLRHLVSKVVVLKVLILQAKDIAGR